ncbi:MAG: hypothetical protein WCJ35_03110 [Planctomycetota bacterium]
MERQSISDPALDWTGLLEHVLRDQVTVEFERDQKVVARLSPVASIPRVSDLNAILAKVPPLNEEQESFAKDVEDIRRSIPTESNPWA